jgi:hypothetical protein
MQVHRKPQTADSIFQRLPSELVYKVLDFMSPLDQVTFATTSHTALGYSNEHLAKLVPAQQQDLMSRAIEWKIEYKAVESDVRSAIRAISNVDRAINVFSPMDHPGVLAVYQALSNVRQPDTFSRNGLHHNNARNS